MTHERLSNPLYVPFILVIIEYSGNKEVFSKCLAKLGSFYLTLNNPLKLSEESILCMTNQWENWTKIWKNFTSLDSFRDLFPISLCWDSYINFTVPSLIIELLSPRNQSNDPPFLWEEEDVQVFCLITASTVLYLMLKSCPRFGEPVV